MLPSLRLLQLFTLLRYLKTNLECDTDADTESDSDVEEDENFEEDALLNTGGAMEGLQVGGIVHFVSSDGAHFAGIIVHVWHQPNGCANIQVFHPMIARTDIFTSVTYSAEPKPYTWHWPEIA